MKIPHIAIYWLGLGLEVFAHGRSPEMTRELNAPAPEWLSIAEPVKVEPLEDQAVPASYAFRPRSGGATNSRNRVQIPARGIEFQVDFHIDYTGKNASGRGVSLSPDGTKLTVNSGTTSHLYEITANGEHRETPMRLPHVTYDDGLKGFITGWSWAGNDVLVGRAEITDETGHEVIVGRHYVFHLKEQALARLDLSALKLPETAGIEIESIGDDLQHFRIRLGDRDIAVISDLKSPPRLLVKPNQVAIPKRQTIEHPPAQRKPIDQKPTIPIPSEEPASTTSWMVVAVVIVTALGLLWWLLKKRK